MGRAGLAFGLTLVVSAQRELVPLIWPSLGWPKHTWTMQAPSPSALLVEGVMWQSRNQGAQGRWSNPPACHNRASWTRCTARRVQCFHPV